MGLRSVHNGGRNDDGGRNDTDAAAGDSSHSQPTSAPTGRTPDRAAGNPGLDCGRIEDILADIECLARSQNRLRILQRLQESPTSSTDLKQELNIPRTTLRRNLIELEEKTWIRTSPTEDVYRIAPPGELFIEQFYDLLNAARTADRLGSFLDAFPGDIPAETACLRACRITWPGPNDPHAPMNRLRTLVKDASVLRAFTPIMCAMYTRMFAEGARSGVDIEVISTPDAVETLQSTDPSVLEGLTDADTGSLLVTDDGLPYGVYLLNGVVVLAAYDDDGRIQSLLEATDEQTEIVDWAERQYEVCE